MCHRHSVLTASWHRTADSFSAKHFMLVGISWFCLKVNKCVWSHRFFLLSQMQSSNLNQMLWGSKHNHKKSNNPVAFALYVSKIKSRNFNLKLMTTGDILLIRSVPVCLGLVRCQNMKYYIKMFWSSIVNTKSLFLVLTGSAQKKVDTASKGIRGS